MRLTSDTPWEPGEVKLGKLQAQVAHRMPMMMEEPPLHWTSDRHWTHKEPGEDPALLHSASSALSGLKEQMLSQVNVSPARMDRATAQAETSTAPDHLTDVKPPTTFVNPDRHKTLTVNSLADTCAECSHHLVFQEDQHCGVKCILQ